MHLLLKSEKTEIWRFPRKTRSGFRKHGMILENTEWWSKTNFLLNFLVFLTRKVFLESKINILLTFKMQIQNI